MNQELLKSILHYSPLTGEFWWLNPTSTGTKPFTKAGSFDRHGYIRIALNNQDFMAHRLAWLYVHGQFPEQLLDHINGDRCDNRIANLRPATKKQNGENLKCNAANTSGYRGVVLHKKTGKWQAQMKHNKTQMYLGLYDTAEMAAQAVKAKRAELFTHDVGRAT